MLYSSGAFFALFAILTLLEFEFSSQIAVAAALGLTYSAFDLKYSLDVSRSTNELRIGGPASFTSYWIGAALAWMGWIGLWCAIGYLTVRLTGLR
jgi:hypothetical protein